MVTKLITSTKSTIICMSHFQNSSRVKANNATQLNFKYVVETLLTISEIKLLIHFATLRICSSLHFAHFYCTACNADAV